MGKVLVVLYIGVLLVEVIMTFFGSEMCTATTELISFDSIVDFYIISLLAAMFLLFCITMITTVVRAKISAAILQSSSQRQQSKLSSIIIALFTLIYTPIIGINIYVYYTYPDNTITYLVIQ